MVVRVVRPDEASRRGIQRLTEIEVRRLVAALDRRSLVTRPAEIGYRRCKWVRHPVDRLPRVPADVADPQFVGPRANRKAERVAQTVADDPAGVEIATRNKRVCGPCVARGRVHADHRPVEDGRLSRGPPEALAAEGAALRRRRRQRRPDAPGRVTAGILGGDDWEGRPAELPVIGVVEVRAVSGTRVQRAVQPEVEVAHRVARELLAPVVDEDLLSRARAGDRQTRHTPAHDTTVGGRTGRLRTGVVPDRGRAPDGGVVGVKDIGVRRRGVVRIECEAE